MELVTPKVRVIGSTQIDTEAISEYLYSIGAPDYTSNAQSAEEYLPEFMGRLCYRSFKPGLNKNVTKVTEGNDTYLSNVLQQGHGSIFEHAVVNFVFQDVSRVFTHELVRHRVGTAISQESLRYVRLDALKVWLPSFITEDKEAFDRCVAKIEADEKHIAWLNEHYDIDNKPFSEKKLMTSAFRRFAPIGLATTIGWSANFRTIRHVLEMRTSIHAEEEIRLIFSEVGRIMKKTYPNLFADYKVEHINGYDVYTTENSKV